MRADTRQEMRNGNEQESIKPKGPEIRSTFAADAVSGTVQAYSKGLRAVYIMIIAFTGATTLTTTANQWEKLSLKNRTRSGRNESRSP